MKKIIILAVLLSSCVLNIFKDKNISLVRYTKSSSGIFIERKVEDQKFYSKEECREYLTVINIKESVCYEKHGFVDNMPSDCYICEYIP